MTSINLFSPGTYVREGVCVFFFCIIIYYSYTKITIIEHLYYNDYYFHIILLRRIIVLSASSLSVGFPVAQWIKRWPNDLAVPTSSPA